ncbi:hypothetical protein ACFWB2_31850 [Streptomyces virginiae]|uniref:hypothetical protein n=1 Tax=Streptomyces virginiae TaxID=1961 RepID=UPI0036A102A8
MTTTPTVHRPPAGSLRVTLPYADDNAAWLREAIPSHRYRWGCNAQLWMLHPLEEVRLLEALLDRYGTTDYSSGPIEHDPATTVNLTGADRDHVARRLLAPTA